MSFLDKINFLEIAKSELKAAGYIMAANQVVKTVNKVVSGAAKKTKNKPVQKFVESVPGKAAVNFALAAGAVKLPRVGDTNPIKYLATGLRVGSLASVGNSVINTLLGRGDKPKQEESVRVPEETESLEE